MIRMAMIGCGAMSRNFKYAFDVLRDKIDLVACVDIVRERAEAAALLHPGARAVTDFREILDDVDGVFCSLPHDAHAPVGIACLEADTHVLMEKPMANTERECLDLIDAADRAGRHLMVALPHPHNPLVVKLKQLIDDKTYGEAFQVSMWTEQYTRPEEGAWLTDAHAAGGGQLFSHGCHYIDLLLRLLGDPIEGSHFSGAFGTPWMTAEGTSHVMMRFDSGALGYHFGTWGAKGTKLGYAFHIHCTEAMLEVDIWEGTLKVYVGGPHISRTSEVTTLMRGFPGFNLQGEMAHFAKCIEEGTQPTTDGRSALQSLRVIWKLYEAEKRGGMADLHGLGISSNANPQTNVHGSVAYMTDHHTGDNGA